MRVANRPGCVLSLLMLIPLSGCGQVKEPGSGNDKRHPGLEQDSAAQTPAQSPTQSSPPPAKAPPPPSKSNNPAQCSIESPAEVLASFTPIGNRAGFATTLSLNGAIDLTNPFFQSLGTNGRSCGSCHDPRAGWSITPELMQQRFAATGGLDPAFRTNDGSVSPNVDTSTVRARRHAYRMLLTKGLIRVGLPIPAGAEFSLAAVDDPYGFASAKELSLFRRPLPSTNLKFLSLVMWDGRESKPGQNLTQSLKSQANGATTGHAQGQPLTDALQEQIVAFETALFSAQERDNRAGSLSANGAKGGVATLSQQPFQIGINDPANPPAFNPNVFSLFGAWLDRPDQSAKASIARGEQIFNLKLFTVQGVGGLNDATGIPQLQSSCSGCHNSPNIGHLSVPQMMNIGVGAGAQRTPDMPLYTLKNASTGATIQVTDPGRALITGKWADIGQFKVPALRNLTARQPYFHDGSAPLLQDVVNFYDQRFQIGFTAQEKRDLIAFLLAL